jgi:hypothetical protein
MEGLDVEEEANRMLYYVDAEGEGKPPMLWRKSFKNTT